MPFLIKFNLNQLQNKSLGLLCCPLNISVPHCTTNVSLCDIKQWPLYTSECRSNGVKWPLRGGYLGSRRVAVGHSWCPRPDDGGEVTGQGWKSSAVHLPPFRTPVAPAERHHGNQRAPYWLAKLLQISTSDSFIESLAYKEVSWGHRGDIMWGFPPECPWSFIMTTEHLYLVPEHCQQGAFLSVICQSCLQAMVVHQGGWNSVQEDTDRACGISWESAPG